MSYWKVFEWFLVAWCILLQRADCEDLVCRGMLDEKQSLSYVVTERLNLLNAEY
jgi:hypothetical protein